ncbi:MAG TPA: putative Ig domain-containing protein, partial [Tepidisphaeraceae bacterium]|nr:putative Ig domain-containing protein [Tepidisphaeraceae bacterium]
DNGDFDQFYTKVTPARYEYRLRCRLSGGARLKRLGIVNDLQMAPLTLPGMVVGENAFTYQDQTSGERKVRITHQWVERSASRPPQAPVGPVFPPDRGEVDGTDLVFQWAPATDPHGDQGDPVVDYHFELSRYDDMRWPLSMSFAKFGSRTADGGKPRYTLPEPGLLNPDTRYFWHVRAKNDKGVWGPWSKTWSFIAHAPAPPVDVVVDFDRQRGTSILRWKPNPIGSKSVKYRVYGSDEKGFSANDEPYKVNVGTCKDLSSSFPANFIAETNTTELAVLGPGVDLPAANKTYYRVVAFDEKGKRSGPSDYAEAPRPVIYSQPLTTATVGEPYHYQARANSSWGDLTARQASGGGQEVLNFWSFEKPRFAIEQGPNWLRIDPATGILSGTPDGPGNVQVVVTASIDREVRKLDEAILKWGNEKVVSVGVQRVGSADQKFTITVTPRRPSEP